ncbi:MAG: SUMF1/EgtB/PvdO family nonheme iron enzyme [Bacteroidetes bacterium]|nr:SUMF1/EgtB/PvdO family nonheme iron enzyme [Bacteroidota bacterium]
MGSLKIYALLIFSLSIFLISPGKINSPPGTVQIQGNLFIDEIEVTNIHWIGYMNWTKEKYGITSKEYFMTFPDTTILPPQASRSEYFFNSKFHWYPVIGISFSQATEYCKWRSDRVNELIYLKENKLKLPTVGDEITIPQIYKYSLPTREIWEKSQRTSFIGPA